MKVAFYLENKDIQNVDFSHPELGNPGCGGTQFLFAATPYYLKKYFDSSYEVFILSNNINYLPRNINSFKVENIFAAAKLAKKIQCDFFIYRSRINTEFEIVELIDNLELSSIAWCHVGISSKYLSIMAKSKFIKKLVCVEHEQYDEIQDSLLAIQGRVTYIPNGFDINWSKSNESTIKDEKLVVYVGALVPVKGFHILAKIWPSIIEKVPSAKLYVIGSGDLYNQKSKLGSWGVADKSYENNHIIPHLSDENGLKIKSVKFLGKLGYEKKYFMEKALIGIVNPSGASENCPGSALEFSSLETAVISGAYHGMLDTIRHRFSGLLGKSEKDLINNIVFLLSDPNYAKTLGKNGKKYVLERYNWERVINQWDYLFNALKFEKKMRRIPFKKNVLYNQKIFIKINRIFQFCFGRLFEWPTIVYLKSYIRNIFIKKLFK